MRPFLVLSATLVFFMSACGQKPQDYKEACPGYNGFVDKIDGKNVRYLCNTHALDYDRVNYIKDSTMRGCATHCFNTPGCLSSMFKGIDRVCFLSNKTQATGPVKKEKMFVYMIQESKSVDPGCEEERRRAQDCERKLEDLRSNPGQPGQTNAPVPKPTQGFDGAGCDNWWNACSRSCDSANVFVDGVEYEKRCLIKPLSTKHHYSDAYISPTECLKEECSGRPGCIGIQWRTSERSKARCWIHFKNGNRDFTLKRSGKYHLLLKKGV